MSKRVIVLEDDPDLLVLVREFLEEAEYSVVQVATVDELLVEAARRAPCVALVDSTNPAEFDLWHLGPKLVQLGVPPVAFTAHASAGGQFEVDSHGYVGIVNKPFDADDFLNLVNSICWDEHQRAAS